ncbi:DNA-processing protein DprA [Companilactobacillus mishanensis]|uniref:DNA-protecting protein DprA n=1 Tax=Companilactobacillus mishanensis TaxID=2486008 RepID=A0A5P0ZF78_9LACO|nr:DNA-processing protein DprA [Companilactobacillus mishanensis]MQS44191.1 DNA-protecting protein DprA [Companilactobacillus mishanensis]MQS51700.1 DNA-protecting protein DprA [Companilactobacillus mishanensis]MQS88489.1 DNA-protecting protein DprA [Companilactobacillus mishanensis]
MEKLNEFLVQCRMTRMVSNQMLLKIISIFIDNPNFEMDSLKMLKLKLGPEKYNEFLLLLRRPVKKDIQVINYLEDSYPNQLREIYNPPAMMFYKGNKNLLLDNCLAIVGARQATEYSYRCISGLVPKVIDRYTVVSGLAQGVDAWSHQVTLNNYGKTIAVIGSSLDKYYPKQNRQLQDDIATHGLLLSEYPPGSEINRWHFPQRNRIIAGLSQKVVVTEAKIRSGALITAELALDSNREVISIPGPIDSSLSAGCNKLIQQGATPLINFNDI